MPPRAFTLVELVMVITLTLILTAGTVAGLSGFESWRAAAAVRRVHADVQYARDLALLSGRRTLCVFDTAAGQYELRQEASPESGALAGDPIEHAVTQAAWRVSLRDLNGSLGFTAVRGVSPASVGFGADGRPVNTSGTVLAQDVRVIFTTGATIHIRAGSGLCEVEW